MSTQEVVNQILNTVIDTCTRLSIVDMGLIEAVAVDDAAQTIEISIRPTTPFCLFLSGIETEIQTLIANNSQVSGYSVQFLDCTEPWAVEKMSEAARATLHV
ncbi:MAG: iron-sulfur cluster assembly protein [Streptococcaceae bacterium]|jgi:metal-sulfur cluster biosynthetic enzyme|nr:iron-sulfur cluster assembly protein [Streptococcaceae bacterium]